MKKAMAILVCVALCLCLFGCAGNGGTSSTTTTATTTTRTTTTTTRISSSSYYHPTLPVFRADLVYKFSGYQISNWTISDGMATLTIDSFISVQCGLNAQGTIDTVIVTVDYGAGNGYDTDLATKALVVASYPVNIILNDQPNGSTYYGDYDVAKALLSAATDTGSALSASKTFNGCTTNMAVMFSIHQVMLTVVIPD